MSIARRRGSSSLLGLGLAFFAGLALLSTTAQASVEIFSNPNGTGSPTGATSVTMDLLLSGYSIQVDDKLFTNFGDYGQSASGTGLVVPAADITVKGLDADPLNPGIQYNSADWSVFGKGTQDTSFSYDVKVVGGQPLMEDASQTLLSGSVGPATSRIVITEQITDIHGNSLTNPNLIVDQVQSPGTFTQMNFDQRFYTLSGSPTTVSFAHVHKDIGLFSNSDSGFASFSALAQNFSEVPEPSTMAIAGLGALGMIGYGLRRRKALGA